MYSGYGRVSDKVQIEYGPPLFQCVNCGHYVFDCHRRELAWEAMPDNYNEKVSKSAIAACVLYSLVGIVLILGNAVSIGMLAIVFGVLCFLLDIRESGQRKEKLDKEREASRKRVQNPMYVMALKQAGYRVPDYAIDQIMNSRQAQNDRKERSVAATGNVAGKHVNDDRRGLIDGEEIQCPVCQKRQKKDRKRCFNCGTWFADYSSEETVAESQELAEQEIALNEFALDKKEIAENRAKEIVEKQIAENNEKEMAEKEIDENKAKEIAENREIELRRMQRELEVCKEQKNNLAVEVENLMKKAHLAAIFLVVFAVAAISVFIFCISVEPELKSEPEDKTTFAKYGQEAEGYVQADISMITEMFSIKTLSVNTEEGESVEKILSEVDYAFAETTDGEYCMLQCGEDSSSEFNDYIDKAEDRLLAGVFGIDYGNPVTVYGKIGSMPTLHSIYGSESLDDADVFYRTDGLTNTEYYEKLSEYAVINLDDAEVYEYIPATVTREKIKWRIFAVAVATLLISFFMYYRFSEQLTHVSQMKQSYEKQIAKIEHAIREL